MPCNQTTLNGPLRLTALKSGQLKYMTIAAHTHTHTYIYIYNIVANPLSIYEAIPLPLAYGLDIHQSMLNLLYYHSNKQLQQQQQQQQQQHQQQQQQYKHSNGHKLGM